MTHLYKQDNSNLQFFAADTAEEEKLARAAGFMTLEELFPPTPEEKARVAAIKSQKSRKP